MEASDSCNIQLIYQSLYKKIEVQHQLLYLLIQFQPFLTLYCKMLYKKKRQFLPVVSIKRYLISELNLFFLNIIVFSINARTISKLGSCKMNPVWYMVLILEEYPPNLMIIH